jgi:hypothetical protein
MKIVKDSFYEILGNEQFDFSTSDPELLVSTVGEILYINSNPNLEGGDFDEAEFDNYLEKEAKDIFVRFLFDKLDSHA